MRKIYLVANHFKKFFLFVSFLIIAFWGDAGTCYSANDTDPSKVANWWTNMTATGTIAVINSRDISFYSQVKAMLMTKLFKPKLTAKAFSIDQLFITEYRFAVITHKLAGL